MKRGKHLNQYIGFRQIEGSVGDLGDEDRVDFRIMLEVLQDLHSFALRGRTVDERFAHAYCVS